MPQHRSSSSSSTFSKTSSDIHQLERVRLQSFQDLLPSAQNRIRSPGRHPHVLLEDILKAEVVSFQLVLAIENMARIVRQILHSEPPVGQEVDNGGDAGSGAAEQSGIIGFQTSLAQSANALDKLTRLDISDGHAEETMESSSAVSDSACNSIHLRETTSCGGPRQSLSLPNGTAKKCSIFDRSVVTDFSPTSPPRSFCVANGESATGPSDATCREDSLPGDVKETDSEMKDDDEVNSKEEMKDAIAVLRHEIEDIQTKHEGQFVGYVSTYFDIGRDGDGNMRKVLEEIMGNLSPQDQNWTYHGRFDEHGMEQLFYFILVQKTLKNCLAIIDTINISERENQEQEAQPSYSQVGEVDSSNGSQQACQLSSPPLSHGPASSVSCRETVINNVQTCNNIREDDFGVKCSSKMNGKRTSEFEDERQHKKPRKSKGFFSCFGKKWPRKRQRRPKN